ncbi:HAD family hydrolase [Spelaeicoccus albus]|uniref:HAD superfamily hydrolase (TIGR01509 family) n=1 Tax=Spelaeicoccus albus TaxID=1280376 RepID=A0A7Z0D3Z4_9MICO|nr:HAD family phosphatase [Spelaeicoccus albus]NYI68423.1 HAD superfamily hydrolase (TIGR01509 family) [Spelaeicoccus albus]
MPEELAAVLWDMDGTLVDTEPYWIKEESRMVAEYGHGRWNNDDAMSLVGNPLLTSAELIRQRGGVDLAPERIVDMLLDSVIEQVHEHVPYRPGAYELLLALRDEGIPCALVTMSYRNFAEAVVESLPDGSFRAIVPGDEVSRGKPDPEPYLTAAAALGVRPEQCVALEDSKPGIGAAEAAGACTVAVPHMVPIDDAPSRTVLPTLDGVTPADLRRIFAASRSSKV